MMTFVYMLLGLLLVGIAALQNFLVLAALFATAFTIRFGALPIVILAICFDGYFGAFTHIPVFSLVAITWYICSELLLLRFRIIK